MAAVTFAIRVLPLTLVKKQFTNTFVRSFLYYVPYVTLSVMTFPAIINATHSPIAGIAAFAAGLVAAWFNAGLFILLPELRQPLHSAELRLKQPHLRQFLRCHQP